MKTWRYRLMTPYQRRALGASVLLSASFHLRHPNHGIKKLGFLEQWKVVEYNSTDALRLIHSIVYKDGNFYRKGMDFPRWEARLRRIPWSVRYRCGLIWGAITCSESIGYLDQ
jgi:hypothetical protein